MHRLVSAIVLSTQLFFSVSSKQGASVSSDLITLLNQMPDPDISSDQYELSYGDPELKNYLMHIDPELEYFDKNVGFYHEAVKVMLQDIKKLYPTLKNLLPHKHNFVKRRESYNQAADLFICEIQSLNEKDIKDLSLYYKEVALILDRLIQQNGKDSGALCYLQMYHNKILQQL